eukprot:m.223802 g.223802  ORF g.223802 m.223802 type:complete len:70 (+) comp16327_c0_seq1:1755-1964(+)
MWCLLFVSVPLLSCFCFCTITHSSLDFSALFVSCVCLYYSPSPSLFSLFLLSLDRCLSGLMYFLNFYSI